MYYSMWELVMQTLTLLEMLSSISCAGVSEVQTSSRTSPEAWKGLKSSALYRLSGLQTEKNKIKKNQNNNNRAQHKLWAIWKWCTGKTKITVLCRGWKCSLWTVSFPGIWCPLCRGWKRCHSAPDPYLHHQWVAQSCLEKSTEFYIFFCIMHKQYLISSA